ncbi:hypothetical protein [Aestuariirhabdus litorea]|uniref:Uncharacterized protein n=1 Tax=Aestuariirhabdus litorea TaxID=2528527 RepID=A0A3P3VQ00_9GAMM|nr:hypothetical protein [Aestuariirhabdus litorea]RRJ84018.1 hypothetical protein D0544_02550 [Aestuariirhabdus litorea]RWW97238.1 hypothetical protein DZC74_02545 [Endozoicomonadaceae bacterium GTF-13]
MTHRAHLLILRIGPALKDAFQQDRYGSHNALVNLMGAGIGILAISLAVACGLPAEYDLYTAMVACLLIPWGRDTHSPPAGSTAALIISLIPSLQNQGIAGLPAPAVVGIPALNRFLAHCRSRAVSVALADFKHQPCAP